MPALATLLVLAVAEPRDLLLHVEGACPDAAEVRQAIMSSLGRAGAQWPEGRRLDLWLADGGTEFRLELAGAGGEILLRRRFHDDARDCVARAETVGLVVARYVESLGRVGEPAPVRASTRPRPATPWTMGVEMGALFAGGVADAGGDTALDAGPQLGARLGRGRAMAVLRLAWLPGDTFRDPRTGGAARVDRVPTTLAGLWAGRWGRWQPAAGVRFLLEPLRAAGRTSGLRTDTSLAVRAGLEAEIGVRLAGPFWLGFAGGLDIALRRIEIRLRDPSTSEPVGVVDQELLCPWVALGVQSRWNLGR